MADARQESAFGLKTFFVVPEHSLFPEEYLKSFFLKGYESYFIEDDPYCPLERKIELLFSLFPQIIIFFNIDRPIQGIDWPVLIGALQRQYGSRAMIGVMFHKRTNPEETRKLEKLYLYTIGILCGCVSLEYQKTKNLYIFLNVLAANQANGQRKYLRAVCDGKFKATLQYNRNAYRVELRDISVSHFSCSFPEEPPEIPLHEKLEGTQLNLHGSIMMVDCVLCLKRVLDDSTMHVFVFRTREGRDGLDPEYLVRVNNIIADDFTTKMQDYLREEFGSIRDRMVRASRVKGLQPKNDAEEECALAGAGPNAMADVMPDADQILNMLT